MNIVIPKFHITSDLHGKAIAVISKERNKRNTILSQILSNTDPSHTYIFDLLSDDWHSNISEKTMYNMYDEKVLEKIVFTKKTKNNVIVLNDCFMDSRDFYAKGMRELLVEKPLMSLLSLQYPQIPRSVSLNIDILFLPSGLYGNYLRAIYNDYGGSFTSFEEFHRIYKQTTGDDDYLVLLLYKEKEYIQWFPGALVKAETSVE
jgi:hypothetical protein